MSISDAAIGALAFGQRAFERRPSPGDRIVERSRAYLERLSAPERSLRFRLALRNLRDEADLLDEDAANDPDVLRLQTRLLELAPTDPWWERHFRKAMGQAPIFRLFAALLSQARTEGADAIMRVWTH